jgi:hypothetical protein
MFLWPPINCNIWNITNENIKKYLLAPKEYIHRKGMATIDVYVSNVFITGGKIPTLSYPYGIKSESKEKDKEAA